MQALITSYLIQKKECNLPLLGHFRIKTKPAELDRAGRQVFPQADEILYSEFAATLSRDLITYVSDLHNITREKAEEEINDWCNYAKKEIDSGEKVVFNSIGSLQKDVAGNIFFERRQRFGFYEPVSAERVFQKNDESSVLAADTRNIPRVTNEFYTREITIEKKAWRIWAIVLLTASFLVLIFYFYTYGFSETAIGNRASLPIQEPPVSHNAP